MKRGTME